jgi:hypothetical protein
MVAGACSNDGRLPGATSACQAPEAALLGCGPRGGADDTDSIREACAKLASCGLVSIDRGDRSFADCISDFDGYPIDALPAILNCIARSRCDELPDPDDKSRSICERYGR